MYMFGWYAQACRQVWDTALYVGLLQQFAVKVALDEVRRRRLSPA